MSLDINTVLLLIIILLGSYLIYKKCILETFQNSSTTNIIVSSDDSTVYDGSKIYPINPDFDNSNPYTDISNADLYVSLGYDDPRLSYKCPSTYPQMEIHVDDPLLQIHRCIKPCNSYPDCSGGVCEEDGSYCILKSDLAAFNECDETGMMPDGTDYCIMKNIESIGDRFQKDYVIPDAYTPVENFNNKKTKKPKKKIRILKKVTNQKKCVCSPDSYTDTKKCYKPCNSTKGEIEGQKNKTVCKNSRGKFFKKSTSFCLRK